MKGLIHYHQKENGERYLSYWKRDGMVVSIVASMNFKTSDNKMNHVHREIPMQYIHICDMLNSYRYDI